MGRKNKSKVFRRKLNKKEVDITVMEKIEIENEVITELERQNGNDKKETNMENLNENCNNISDSCRILESMIVNDTPTDKKTYQKETRIGVWLSC